MARPDHIHIVGDGRGTRTVYLNGAEVKRCIYADTHKGLVRFYGDPYKVHKYGKRLIHRTKRGVVEVVWNDDQA